MKQVLTICSIIGCIFLLTQCINRQKDAAVRGKISRDQFAGSATCGNCHREIYQSHIHTAHYHTSAPANDSSVLGNFENGKNVFAYNPAVWIAMEKRDSGLYQAAYLDGSVQQAHRFDIVVGSGAKGQTSVYWQQNKLFQLPISYFTAAHEWSNSPGFPQRPVFNRPITSRCLECHSTYVNTLSPPGQEAESFDRTSFIYGVDCEKCHGPGAQHAAYQLQHPEEKTAKYIVNPAALTRQQQLDACALCHGGRLQKTKPSFEFTVGDKLSDFFVPKSAPVDPDNIDLHGNQYGLLQASKCFKNSGTMTCNTCHNTHENERGRLAVFATRCQTCHQSAPHGNNVICKMTDSLGASFISTRCVDCHMPAKASRAISVFLPGKDAATSAYIRSHFITIYRDETSKVAGKKKLF